MKRRVWSLFLALVMTLSLCMPAYATDDAGMAEDGEVILNQIQAKTEDADSVNGTGVVSPRTVIEQPSTRAEWLYDLVSIFELDAEDDSLPDNYYPDLAEDSDYYREILVAMHYGMVDVEPGDALNPSGAITRDFAAYTLNSRLAHRLEDEGYTFSDSGDVAHPDDAQAAVDAGWLALVGGKFLPNRALTTQETAAMIQAAQDGYASVQVDTGHSNSFVFNDGVKEIPQGTTVEEPNSGTLLITDCPVEIAVGDTIAAYVLDIPSVYEVESVAVEDGVTTVTGTPVNLGDATQSIDAQGTFDVGLEYFSSLDDSEFYYIFGNGTRTRSQELARSRAKQLKAIKGEKKIALGNGVELKVSFVMPTPQLSYDLGWNRAWVNLDGDITATCTISADIDSVSGIPSEVPLAEASIPGVGKIGIYAYLSIDGSVTVTVTGRLSVGADYNHGYFYVPVSFNKTSMTLTAKVDVDAGFKAQMKFTLLPILKGNVYARVGAHIGVVADVHESGTPHNCITTKQYLYGDAGYSVTAVKKFSGNYVFLDKNSYCVVQHYEDGVQVPYCTFGQSGGTGGDTPYYTPPTSRNYTNGGWSGGNGTVLGSDWEPIEVYSYELDDDNNAIITGFHGNVSALTIPDQIDGHTVVGIGSGAFEGMSQLRVVTIPNTVTSIGNYAFYECGNLTDVNLPGSLKECCAYAFGNCTSLTAIEIPKSLELVGSSYSYNYCGPFAGCDSLKTVTFEEGTTTVVDYLFAGCSGLENIVIPETVTRIQESAFRGCEQLKDVQISTHCTEIEKNAFLDCVSLEEITIPEGCTSIESGTFQNCSSLTEAVLPDTVTKIDVHAFDGCSSLTDVTLPKYLTELAPYAFGNCTSLAAIEIPRSLETVGSYYYYDFNGPFAGCDSLKTVTFEEGTTTVVDYLFAGCSGLESIVIPETVTRIRESAFRGCEQLKNVQISAHCTEIEDNAFLECVSLEEITIPENCTSIGACAFQNCSKLAKVTIPDTLNRINVHAFDGCSSLTDVTLPKYLTELAPYAFGNCTSLTAIEIPKSLESVGSYYYYDYFGPFVGCDALKTVTFEEGTTTVVDYLFAGCSGLESIVIPETVTRIQESAFRECKQLKDVQISTCCTEIGNQAFYQCEALEEITMPDSVKELGNSVFEDCTALTDVVLSESLTELPGGTFRGCTALPAIVLPDGIETIGIQAFMNCTSLETVQLPEALRSIGYNAFGGCVKLKNPAFPAALETIDDEAFSNCDALTAVTIPNSVTRLGNNIFYDCDALADVQLGNGITEIPESAFEHCDKLQKLTVPYRVTTIGSHAFKDCVRFTEITIPRTVTEIAADAFSYPGKLTIYGVAGTYAETYAGDIGATFVAINHPAESITLNKTELTMNNGSTVRLTATITPADFTDSVKWKTSNSSVVTVTQDGEVEAVGTGTATVTVVAGNKKATCSITVVEPAGELYLSDWSATLDAGETLQLVAEVGPDDAYDKSVAWSSSDETVATVDQTGLVTALKKGSAVITVTALGATDLEATCDITVRNNLYIVTDPAQFQSPHPYETDCSDIWRYTIPGAAGMEITFSNETSVEEDCDYLYVYDGNGEEVGVYTGTELAGQTLQISGDTVSVKLVSDDSYCEYGFAVMSVKESVSTTPLEITSQPEAVTATSGATVHFAVGATGDGLTYQWQIKTPTATSWVNSTAASGKTAALSVAVTAGKNGYQYRCVITDVNGNQVTSDAAKLTVLPAITTQPKNVSAKVGDTVKFTVTATGANLQYQWQIKTPTGSWTNSTAASGKTAALSVAVTAGKNGYQYRCVITDANGAKVTSSAAKLTVLPAITTQPKSVSAKVGDTVKFTVTATGANLQYQWQIKTPTGSWTNSTAASGKTAALSVAVTAGKNGYQYRCVITDANGAKVTSSTAKLTVLPAITAQPKAISAKVGETVKFTVTATGANLQYQWQIKTPGSTTWVNSTAASGKTAALSVAVTAGKNGYQYRCVITDANGAKVTSSTAKLTVKPTITTQPKSVTATKGTTTSFKVTATGAGLQYQWQISTDGGRTWVNSTASSGKTASLSVAVTAGKNGYRYRCVITDANGAKVTSSAATLTVR